MNTSKKITSPTKWNWLKMIGGLIALGGVISAIVIFVLIGILGYPFYLFKRYINKRIQKRKNW